VSGASEVVTRRVPMIRPGTFVALGLAIAALGLSWLDPFAGEGDPVAMVSTNSPARRVFPTLGDEDSSKATIELQPAGQPLIRMVPGPDGGHQLLRGETLLGPVDDDAFEGLLLAAQVLGAGGVVPDGRILEGAGDEIHHRASEPKRASEPSE